MRDTVFPVAPRAMLQDLVAEFKSSGPTYQRTVKATLKASYTNHYRTGLIKLLDVLEFRSNNTTHRPVLDAVDLVARHASAGNLHYYPVGEHIPTHRGLGADWDALVYKTDTRGRRRVVRMVYEVCTFQALREQLRCKEIWVVGADKWRNPAEDLPTDFEDRRGEHCRRSANPWTPRRSSRSCVRRCAANWTPSTRRCLPVTGWRSATGRQARSSSPQSTPRRSRGTFAG
ncbi:hypothetical protein [Actinomadura sp. 7K507]|uniref:hypothetical protein n=1 Tax=Actinomadura sp. 7K507 TaxID=2530365 RepID=UPI001404DBD3|nr:hypothetical protein [Actinomadura sp. 7K507]